MEIGERAPDFELPDADYEDPSQGAAWLRGAIDAVLEGRDPDPERTPAVGRGVKWRS